MTSPAVVSSRKVSNGKASTPLAELADVPMLVAAVPVTSIDLGPNVRKDVGDLEDLVASIKEHGILQPIKLREAGARYVVVWGQRRYLAAVRAGLETVPAIIVAGDTPVEGEPIEQLVENIVRADLNPIDEAKALRQVLDADKTLTQDELAKRLGRSAPWVSNSLRLLETDPKVQKLVAGGELTAAHAKALAGLAPKTQLEVAKEAVQRGLSAHGTEGYVRQVKEQEAWRKKRAADEQQEAAAKRAATARRIEDAAKKIPKDAPVHIGGGYYGNGVQVATVHKLFREAGFTEVAEAKGTLQTRPKGTICDCTDWKVEIGWSGGLTIVKACTNEKHTNTAYETKVGDEKQAREFQDRVRDRVQAYITEQALELFHRSPNAARIFLWISFDWSLNDWVRDHRGDRKKPDAWDEIASLPEGELAVELAKFVRKGFTDRYNVKLDWPRIAAELGIEAEPAETSA